MDAFPRSHHACARNELHAQSPSSITVAGQENACMCASHFIVAAKKIKDRHIDRRVRYSRCPSPSPPHTYISKTKNKSVQNKAITGLGSRPEIRQERTQKLNLLFTSTKTQRTDDSLRRQRAPHQRTHRRKHRRNQCQRCRLSMSRRLGWQVSSHGTGGPSQSRHHWPFEIF